MKSVMLFQQAVDNGKIRKADILQRSNRENAEWLGLRARVKSSHSILTDAMKAAGITEQYMYINAANVNYRTLFGKTAKELRNERGALDARASLSSDELSALEFAERAQAKMLPEGKPEDNKAVVAELRRIAENVRAIMGMGKAA